MGAELNSIQKAAVLVMALDDERAAELLKHVSEESLVKIRKAAESLNVAQIEDEQKRDALQGFFLKQRKGGFFLGDPKERFRRVLEKAKGAEGARRLLSMDAAAEKEAERRSPREFLEELSEEQLASVLQKESPRCSAVLLSNLSGAKAGRVLNLLEEEAREAIVGRLVASDVPPAEVCEQIMTGFQQRVEELGETSEMASEEKRTTELAAMLATLNKDSQDRVLSQMHDRDPEMADQVERLMFGFGDLTKVSDRSMQELLRGVEVTQIAMALKGAPDRISKQFISNMSQRLQERVEEEREMTGRVPLSQVEEAREAIMKVARKMYRQGELVVEMGNEEYVE